MRRLLGWGLAGVVLAVGAWVLVSIPRLDTGPMRQVDEESFEEETDTFGEEDTMAVVLDPSDGTYDGLRTYTNEGLVPVTVRLGEGPAPDLHLEASLQELDERTLQVLASGDSVTVPRGATFAISFAFGLGCARSSPGTTTILHGIELEVTSLGLTRTVTAPLGEAVGVTSAKEHLPAADCPG